MIMNRWHSVIAVLAVVIASSVMWCITINIALHTGSWVGAGGEIPIKTSLIALSPSIVDLVVGVMCIPFRRLYRIVGITALIVTAMLLLPTGWVMAMMSIG